MAKILDCTIRDGGHLNGWNFTDECAAETFRAAALSGVGYFETGYRGHGDGKFARCLDEDLRSLFGAKCGVKLGVMLNVREYSAGLFYENDFADFVRVAAHPHEIPQGVEICANLQQKGYVTILHLMDAANISDGQFKALEGYDKNSILYFADSYGALLPEDVRKCFEIFRARGFEKIGFHGHNNKQLAFINTLTAIDCGAYAVDVTAYGMGRGAGNTPAELLLAQLGKNAQPYFDLIEKYYVGFHRQTPWGYSLENLRGGLLNAKVQ